MNNPEEIKRLLTPIQVVQHYLGSPKSRTSLGCWYKSPFRNETDASFLVYSGQNRNMFDFGSNTAYDIIDFIQEYFNVDFKMAMKILTRDFGLPEDKEISKELKEYLLQRKKERERAEYIIKTWYNKRFNDICTELHSIQNAIPYLSGEALKIAYEQEVKYEVLSEMYLTAYTDEEKLELYKIWINRRKGVWI